MPKADEPDAIKAVSCEIPLGEAVLDAYMLPSGEKRIGVENTGIALGYKERWFYNFFQRSKRQTKAQKALQDMGFSGAQLWVNIVRHGNDKRGALLAKTISMRDFVKLVTYEAIIKRNTKAIVLLAAFAETGLERILEDAFAGRSIDFLLDKIVHYSKWTYEELEVVLQYNREELRALYSWGGYDLSHREDSDENYTESGALKTYQEQVDPDPEKSKAFQAFLDSAVERKEVYRRLADS